jgi:O-antigen ligase
MYVSRIPSIIATFLIIIACIYFIRKKRYAAITFIFLFYLHSLFSMNFPFGSAVYYSKWFLHIGIILAWSTLVIIRWLGLPPNVYRKSQVFALLFIISAMMSALLCENTVEASTRAGTFFLLFVMAYIIIPTESLEKRIPDLFQSLQIFDGAIMLISGLGLVYPGFYRGGRFVGVFTLPTFMVVFAYSYLITSLAALSQPKKFKVRYFLFALISIIVVGMTQSRAGYLAAAVGVAVFYFFLNRKVFWVLSVTMALVLILTGLLFIQWAEVSKTVFRGSSVEEIVGVRMYYMERALKYFKEEPFFGIGMGTIPKGVHVIQDPSLPFASSMERVANQAGYSLLLVETGLTGLGLYLMWLFSSLSGGWRKPEPPFDDSAWLSFRAAFIGLFVAYAVHGIFEGFPASAGNIVAVRMWAMAGVFVLFPGTRRQRVALAEPQATTPSAMRLGAPVKGFGHEGSPGGDSAAN